MAEWLAKQQGVTTILHFLYDFLVNGHTDSAEGVANVMLLLLVLGIPVAVEKVEGSCLVITFLGIEPDTIQGISRLPTHKLEELQNLITTKVGRKSCLKWDLVQHACKVVRPGESFLRRMFEVLCRVSKKNHHICLNYAFRLHPMWLHTFLGSWNGKAMMRS